MKQEIEQNMGTIPVQIALLCQDKNIHIEIRGIIQKGFLFHACLREQNQGFKND